MNYFFFGKSVFVKHPNDHYLQSFELDFKKDDKVLGESEHNEGDTQPDPENQRTNAFGSGMCENRIIREYYNMLDYLNIKISTLVCRLKLGC